jgi:hypothetical protein
MERYKQILISITTIALVSISPSLLGQDTAHSKAKQPRHGDKLNRQQVEYIDPGGADKSKETVWDISGIKIVKPDQKRKANCTSWA